MSVERTRVEVVHWKPEEELQEGGGEINSKILEIKVRFSSISESNFCKPGHCIPVAERCHFSPILL